MFASVVTDVLFVLNAHKTKIGGGYITPPSFNLYSFIMKNINGAFVLPYNEGFLLYNSYTDGIKYVNSLDFNTNQIKDLINSGVFLPENVDGPSLSRFIIHRIKNSNQDCLQITDAFSYACNLKCVYCMQQNIHNTCKKMDPSSRVEEWQKLMELHQAKFLNVCLFGGEPFFDSIYIEKILKIAHERIGEIGYTVVTNGTLINNEVIKLINTFSIDRIQITLDGPESIHNNRRITSDFNCFKRIIKNIHTILENTKSTILLNTVIDTANFSDIDNLTDILIKEFSKYIFNDHPRLIINYGMECHPFGKSEYTNKNIPQLKKYYVDFLNLLEKEIQKGIAVTEILPTPTCIAKVENDVLISPNGDIYKCISGLDVPDFKICSYNELMNNELYYHERIATFSEKEFSSCINCKFLSLCNGGCFYEAALNGKEQACQKDLMEAQMPQLIKLRYLTEEIESGVFRIHGNRN